MYFRKYIIILICISFISNINLFFTEEIKANHIDYYDDRYYSTTTIEDLDPLVDLQILMKEHFQEISERLVKFAKKIG